MNILRALFLNNSNKADTTAPEPTKTTTHQSIEFMSKFNLRILCWELRISYHKNQQTASALPLPIQKWLKQQQEQFPHADWMMDQVEKSILDEIKDSPAAIQELVSKAADQRDRNQPPVVAAAPTPVVAQAPADLDPMDCSLQAKPAHNFSPGYSYPMFQKERDPFQNFDNLQFDKKQILRVFGMEDSASSSASGPRYEEERFLLSNSFSRMPQDWNEVVMGRGDALAATRLIPPLAQNGVPPGIAAAAAMAHPPLPQEMGFAPAHVQYAAAANGQYRVVNNNDGNIWRHAHGAPAGQHIPWIPRAQQQQPRQDFLPVPTGQGFLLPDGYTFQQQQLQTPMPSQHLQYQQQQEYGINPYGNNQHPYYHPAAARQIRSKARNEMHQRIAMFYEKYYRNYYEKLLREYQQAHARQQQPAAPRRPQPLFKQQQHQGYDDNEGNAAYVSAQVVIDMEGAGSASTTSTQQRLESIDTDWEQEYQDEFCNFYKEFLRPRLGKKLIVASSSVRLECINAIGKGVNGDIHVVRYYDEPPTPTPRPIQFIMKKVKFANIRRVKGTADKGKKMALYYGAEEEVFGLTLDHPNLMQLYQVFLNTTTLHLEIIMPRMTASLSTLNSALIRENAFPYNDERYAWYIMYNFLQGLDCLHKYGRFHGDIKPANVLVSEIGEIKLTDFGLCGSTNSAYRHLRGTPMYLAPEVAATEFDSNARYNFKSDMYSTGIMMYEFLMGHPASEDCPYTDNDIQTEQGWRWVASRKPVVKEGASSKYKLMLSMLLARNPNNRPTPEYLLHNTEHFRKFRIVHQFEEERQTFCNDLLHTYLSVEAMDQV